MLKNKCGRATFAKTIISVNKTSISIINDNGGIMKPKQQYSRSVFKQQLEQRGDVAFMINSTSRDSTPYHAEAAWNPGNRCQSEICLQPGVLRPVIRRQTLCRKRQGLPYHAPFVLQEKRHALTCLRTLYASSTLLDAIKANNSFLPSGDG